MSFKYNPFTGKLDEVGAGGGGSGASYWSRTGTVLSPTTAGDWINIQDGSSQGTFIVDSTNRRIGMYSGTYVKPANQPEWPVDIWDRRTQTSGTQQTVRIKSEANPATNSSALYETVVLHGDTLGTVDYSFGTTAFSSQARHLGTGTCAALWGHVGAASNVSTGTVTWAYGGMFRMNNNSTGTITNAYSMYIFKTTNPSGTIINSYGLYIENFASFGTTLNYSIYVEGGKAYLGDYWTTRGYEYNGITTISLSNHNVSASDESLIHVTRTTTGSCTISIPTALCTGIRRRWEIKDKGYNCATNNITVSVTGGTINNESSYVMNINGMSITVCGDGAGNADII